VAVGWQAMWDVSRHQGPAEFELEAAKALAAWRSSRFELPWARLLPDRSIRVPGRLRIVCIYPPPDGG
jgi:hypothetical protein